MSKRFKVLQDFILHEHIHVEKPMYYHYTEYDDSDPLYPVSYFIAFSYNTGAILHGYHDIPSKTHVIIDAYYGPLPHDFYDEVIDHMDPQMKKKFSE